MKENEREFLYNANLIRASVLIVTEAHGWNEDITQLFMLKLFEGRRDALIHHNVALGLADFK